MSKYIFISIYLFAFFVPAISFSQDGGEDDPYSDYSYLWEDSKKKKKKDRKKKEEPAQNQTIETPAADSTNLAETEYRLVSDSIPKDSIDVAESTPEYIPPADSIVEEEVAEEELAEEPKEKWSDREIEPVSDFRAGMGSGGSGSFTGGVTYTQIGSNAYVGVVLSPEFRIGKVGVGLSVPILYGLDDQKVRTEIFKGGVGPLRLVR
ncbi:MAG: hypothetical protein ABJJ14_08275, partial [Cyclobacteriaceae bacterium]